MLKKGSALVAIILILVMGALLYTGFFNLKQISYTEDDRFDEADLVTFSHLREGVNLFLIDTEEEAKRLAEHPLVKGATVKRIWPDGVDVRLEFREHLCYLKNGDLYLSIDSDTIVLSAGPVEDPKGYLIEGFDYRSFKTGEPIEVDQPWLLENLLVLMELFDASHLDPLPTVKLIGDEIFFSMTEGFNVNFGNGEKAEERFNDFVNIHENLAGKGVVEGTIDVSTDGLPFYKPFGN